jgi:hypothetical protein
MGLETVEIIMEVERRFGISVPDEVALNCITVADLQRVVTDHLVAKSRQRSPELDAEVLRELIRISAEITGNDPATIRPDSRWVGDVTTHG